MYTFRQFYIPDRMLDGITNYINHGYEPGSFLSAVICNDFSDACGCADDENLANLPAYAAYFHNEAPSACHGSREKMLHWLAAKTAARVIPVINSRGEACEFVVGG